MELIIKLAVVLGCIIAVLVIFALPIAVTALASVEFGFQLSIQMLGLAGLIGLVLAMAALGTIADYFNF